LVEYVESVVDIQELSRNLRAKIVDELGDEFCKKGLKVDHEPNSYGLELEALIDVCEITKED
jgi:hypothetical protein